MKVQEILYLIGTKIFQFGQRRAEKIELTKIYFSFQISQSGLETKVVCVLKNLGNFFPMITETPFFCQKVPEKNGVKDAYPKQVNKMCQ